MAGKLTKIKAGKAIGAQTDFAETINTLIDFVKNLEGAGDILLDRGSFPTCRIKMRPANDNPNGGIPPGYEERANSIVDIQWDSSAHKLQIKRGTVLVKTGTVGTTWSDVIVFEEFNI